MLVSLGIKVCKNTSCTNCTQSPMSLQSALQYSERSYCNSCVDNGLDYVYVQSALLDRNGTYRRPEGQLEAKQEEQLYLQKVKRRRHPKDTSVPFGVFSKKDYQPRDRIGYLAGVFLLQKRNYAPADPQDIPVQKAVAGGGRGDMCFVIPNTNLIVDASQFGNITRFLRRSCRPNVQLRMEQSGCEWKNTPPIKKIHHRAPLQVALHAIRHIRTDTELVVGRSTLQASIEAAQKGTSGFLPCLCANKSLCISALEPKRQMTRAYHTRRTSISPLFVKMHARAPASLYAKGKTFPLFLDKCVFIREALR